MKYRIQKLNIPNGFTVLKNDFSVYDPEVDFDESDNSFYLWEDLLQIAYRDLIVDLGWYGNVSNNDGEFKIMVVQNQDWENPVVTERSKSQKVIAGKLQGLLDGFAINNPK